MFVKTCLNYNIRFFKWQLVKKQKNRLFSLNWKAGSFDSNSNSFGGFYVEVLRKDITNVSNSIFEYTLSEKNCLDFEI